MLLTDQTNRLVEFTDGHVEVLPIPSGTQQTISQRLFLALLSFVQRIGGIVQYAPLRIRIRSDKFREPDLLLMRDAADPRRQDRYWLGADLVVEIVSPDRPERDTHDKVVDYAEAGIPEYWIVNPETATITVLRLMDDTYREHGVFHRSDTATSVVLDGFVVGVDDVLGAR
jgi:Uma2 family endonuclease